MDDDQMSDSNDIASPAHQGFNIVDVLAHHAGGHAAPLAQSSMSASSEGELNEALLKSSTFKMDVDQSLLNAEEEHAILNLKRLYPLVDQKKTPIPRYWSPTDKCQTLKLSHNCLEVEYIGRGNGNKDAASVRANVAIPRSCGVYYYEIQIIKNGDGGYLGVGLCDSNVLIDRLPGWESVSFGYHGDDGHFFESSGKGVIYGPKFEQNDIIGCGVNFVLRTLFFTRNGKNLGVAMRNVPIETPFFPTIGIQTQGETITTNFGQRAFVYNLEDELKQTERQTLLHIGAVELPAEKSLWIARSVSSWLANAGYAKTLVAFNEATGLEAQIVAIDQELTERREIMQLIIERRAAEAIRRVDALSSRILDNQNQSLRLLLMLQEFVDRYTAMRSNARNAGGSGDESARRRSSFAVAAAGGSRPSDAFALLHSDEEAATTSGVSFTRRSSTAADGGVHGGGAGEAMHVDGGGGGAHAAIVPTNGYANGLSASGSSRQTNGSVHSSTNGTSNAAAVAVTSTSIVAERDDGAIADDDDAISLTSELSEESSDCLTKDADVEQFDFHDVDPAYSALINFGQSISAFAAKIENLSPELQRRMDDVFSLICYNTPSTSPKSYLLDSAFRAFLARTLNTAIMTTTCGERCQTPDTLFRLAREARNAALQNDVVGANLAHEERIFQAHDAWLDAQIGNERAA